MLQHGDDFVVVNQLASKEQEAQIKFAAARGEAIFGAIQKHLFLDDFNTSQKRLSVGMQGVDITLVVVIANDFKQQLRQVCQILGQFALERSVAVSDMVFGETSQVLQGTTNISQIGKRAEVAVASIEVFFARFVPRRFHLVVLV